MLSPALASALLTASLETGSGGGAELHLARRSCISAEISLGSSTLPAEEISTQEAPRAAPDFIVVEDDNGIGAVCASRALGIQALRDTVERVRRRAGTDPQIAVVLTSSPIGCGDIFYVPIANDVRGIGYQHSDAREVFDDSPDSRLEGIVFLNDFPYWALNAEEFATVFNHELGHRWGARVHVVLDDMAPAALLGREAQHWSYFFDTQGSPLEGNAWTVLGDRGFRAYTPLGGATFSDLDLYLMGVLRKEDVAPARLLEPKANDARDCKGNLLGSASPPQWCEPLELEANEVSVPIDAIIEAEGARAPGAANVTKGVDVALIVVSTDPKPLDAEGCSEISTAIEQRLEGFEAATGGRISLNNLTASEASCNDWATPEEAQSGGCALAPSSRSSKAEGLLVWVALAIGCRRWRRTECTRVSRS